MPTYKKVKASTRRAALQKIQSVFGDINITIVKENVIKGKKKMFFGKEKDQYEIIVAMYTGEEKLVKKKSQDEGRKEQREPVSETIDFVASDVNKGDDNYGIKEKIERVQKKRKESIPVFEGLPSLNKNLTTALNNYMEVDTGNRNEVGSSNAYSAYLNKGNTAVLEKEEIKARKMMRRRSEEEVLQEIKARKTKVNLSSDNNESNKFSGYTERDYLKYDAELGEVYKGHNVYSHPIYNFLIDRDFDASFVRKIVTGCGSDKHFSSSQENYRWLAKVIANQFNYSKQINVVKNKQNFIYFVGPTGVGKTTTLAKIAASFFLKKCEKKVSTSPETKLKIASFDIKRMMAMEQMGAFAKIIQVPFRKLFSKEDLVALIGEVNKGELVLVDTSGVSIKEQEDIDEISSFINLNDELKLSKRAGANYLSQAYLCLNVGYRYNDLKKIFKSFSPTGFNKVVLTKQDESYSLGSVLSMLSEHDCEIAYLTDGQDVPNDLQVATAELLEEKLIEEWSF